MFWRLVFIKLCFVTTLFSPLIASAAENQNEYAQLLARMGYAMRELTYEGELILHQNDRIETLQMVHTVQEGQERERLTSLNGTPREIIRDQEKVICVLPDSHRVSVGPRGNPRGFREITSETLSRMIGHYRLTSAGEARVAGRETQVLQLAPSDDLRYGLRLFIDRQTKLPLKQQLYDAKGKTISLIMYSRIRIDDDIPYETSLPSISTEGFSLMRHDRGTEKTESSSPFRWRFGPLPAGFQVSDHFIHAGQPGDSKEHLILSDGLASVSLFIEAMLDAGLEGPSRMGAVNAYSRCVPEARVTALGEVPERTVRLIAEAVEFLP
jgi:sigma-E factor negative regulatory protein RseB